MEMVMIDYPDTEAFLINSVEEFREMIEETFELALCGFCGRDIFDELDSYKHLFDTGSLDGEREFRSVRDEIIHSVLGAVNRAGYTFAADDVSIQYGEGSRFQLDAIGPDRVLAHYV